MSGISPRYDRILSLGAPASKTRHLMALIEVDGKTLCILSENLRGVSQEIVSAEDMVG